MKRICCAIVGAAILSVVGCRGYDPGIGVIGAVPDDPLGSRAISTQPAVPAGQVVVGRHVPAVGTLVARPFTPQRRAEPDSQALARLRPQPEVPRAAVESQSPPQATGMVAAARSVGRSLETRNGNEIQLAQLQTIDEGAAALELFAPSGSSRAGEAETAVFLLNEYDERTTPPSIDPLPVPDPPPSERFPINLATALSLAGSNNLQISLAQERIQEAYARQQGAEVLWMPNLVAGVGYNDHSGQIQATPGNVIETNRDSLFVGGGAALGPNPPLTGGSGGPARLAVSLSLVDACFEPLAARQVVQQARSDSSSTFNDTLLQVTLGYLELVRAQSALDIVREADQHTDELLQVTEDFARTGAGLDADAYRTQVVASDRQRALFAAEEQIRVASAELARLLRLQQSVTLYALEAIPVPITVVSEELTLETLIAQGVTMRPEASREYAQIRETSQRQRQEELRPWVPNLHVGIGTGGFGGGAESQFTNFSGRYDLDVLAVWEVRNLGLGNRAIQRERRSQSRQANMQYHAVRDQIATDVTQAFYQVQSRGQQIDLARTQVEYAAAALPMNLNGIRGRELRPIEALQAILALANARERYLNAVIGYNQAQFALLRAIGQPPNSTAAAQGPVRYDETNAPPPAPASEPEER